MFKNLLGSREKKQDVIASAGGNDSAVEGDGKSAVLHVETAQPITLPFEVAISDSRLLSDSDDLKIEVVSGDETAIATRLAIESRRNLWVEARAKLSPQEQTAYGAYGYMLESIFRTRCRQPC